ncbi:MAG TPA: alpha/beta hydrolase [Thermoanaerobaculia bacterium]
MGRVPRRGDPEPLCRFLKFEATDRVELYGLLFEPRRPSGRVAIFLHGTGGASIFDSRRTNLLASEFVENGIAYFPFNNRGAHVLKRLRKQGSRKRSIGGGMAYERIRDCVYDIDGALRALRARGYRDFTLIGHSTGANKIAVYDHYRPRNPVRHYVFLGGGDDVGIMYEQLGPRRFRTSLERARERRNSDELVPPSISPQPMSWRSFFDMTNPDGDYNIFPYLEVLRDLRLSRRSRFRYLRGVHKPSLVVYGDRDEYCYGDVSRCVSILSDAIGPKPNFEFVIMEDTDHGFSGREVEVAQLIVDWIP